MRGSSVGSDTLPRISVVIPSLNQGRFIEQAIKSVVDQPYPRVECLVCDGGSQDETVEILRRESHSLTFWCSEPDRGQSHAINKGLERATGELITFIGSDDFYLPGAFAHIASQFVGRSGCGGVVGAFRFADEESRLGDAVPPRLPGAGPMDLRLVDPRAWRLHQVASFFAADALDEVGRFVNENLRYTMDRELLFRVLRRYPIALADQPCAAFRLHDRNKSSTDALPFCSEMADLYRSDEPTLGAVAFRRRMVRYWHAKGHLKMARGRRGAGGAVHLAKAARERPALLFSRQYAARWFETLGLRKLAATRGSPVSAKRGP